jgi:subtilisin family serine protease
MRRVTESPLLPSRGSPFATAPQKSLRYRKKRPKPLVFTATATGRFRRGADATRVAGGEAFVTQLRSRALFGAAISAAILALSTATASAGPHGAAVTRSEARRGQVSGLDRAAARGVLDDRLLERVRNRGEARALVIRRPGSRLAATGGVDVIRRYSAFPVSLVRVESPRALLELVSRSQVESVSADGTLYPALAESLPLIRQPEAAAAGDTGAGTAVAVIDTGVDYSDPVFGGCGTAGAPGCKVVYAQDFGGDDGQLDDNGHGTNVAAIVLGVAPNTGILGLDVFGATGTTRYSDVLAAVNFAVANQQTYDIRALNLSLGSAFSYSDTECTSSNPFVTAFASARAVGILPVVAAGNDAYRSGVFQSGVSFPACTPGAVRVGAVYDGNVGGLQWGTPPSTCTDASTTADQITCFSQTGPLLTVLAPGALITAAGITEGGTSQAAPHVAGAAAVLAAALPSASVDTIQTAIAESGPSITDPRNNLTRHRLDLVSAVSALGSQPTPVYRPDALIKLAGDSFLKGGDIYNTSGAFQTRSTKARRGRTKTFLLKVQNDALALDDIGFVGQGSTRGFTVTYFSGTSNVTRCVTRGCHFVGGLASGSSRDLRMVVTVGRRVPAGTLRTIRFVVSSNGDPSMVDVVKARVTARR